MAQFLGFGNGGDGDLSISSNTTDSPVDSSCSGTAGTTSLTATNASFSAGDIILIHQSRGTGVGAWELNQISSYVAGTITTAFNLANTYTDSGASQAQVLVVKQYSSITIDTGKILTTKVWNENVGGILAYMCSGIVTITGTITANGKGFAADGAAGATGATGQQGEGTNGAGSVSTSANGNGGGGGKSDGASGGGSGGGGGGNGVAGSEGVAGFDRPSSDGGDGGGVAGAADLTTMVFGGEGGGGGHDSTGAAGAGGNGAGIILIFAKDITISGGITSNGSNGSNSVVSGSGAGGGGAGGSVLIKAQTATLGTTKITATAGAGGGVGHVGGAGGVGRRRVEACSIAGSGYADSEVEGGQEWCGAAAQILGG